MSTIEDSNVVDFVGTDTSHDGITLAISDHLDWEREDEHLLLLQEKINRYLSFIESGEVFERVSEIRGRQYPKTSPITVRIYFRCELSARARDFVEGAREVLESIGLRLIATVGLPS
jgi:hypothetical protein